jgi:hypothetical protein
MNSMVLRNDGLELTKHGLSVVALRQREQIIATLGGTAALSAIDLIRIDQAVRMLQRSRRKASAEDMVRLNNAAVKIIDQLQRAQRQAKLDAPVPSTRERIHAALAELPT